MELLLSTCKNCARENVITYRGLCIICDAAPSKSVLRRLKAQGGPRKVSQNSTPE